MAAGSASSAAAEKTNLLYPELMPSATIVKILKERYVKHPRLEELDKAALVQLYEKTVLPLPQREYRDTRTGRALVALRERADSRRKRKASTDASSDPPSTKQQRHDKPSKPEDNRRRSQPHESTSKRNKNAGTAATNDSDKWGSWDNEPSSSTGRASATNRCHSEGDGPPRKKHHTPITWP